MRWQCVGWTLEHGSKLYSYGVNEDSCPCKESSPTDVPTKTPDSSTDSSESLDDPSNAVHPF